RKFVGFRRAYDDGGLSVEEFDSFPPTRRTLRQFITACHDLDGLVPDFLLPNPDVSLDNDADQSRSLARRPEWRKLSGSGSSGWAGWERYTAVRTSRRPIVFTRVVFGPD